MESIGALTFLLLFSTFWWGSGGSLDLEAQSCTAHDLSQSDLLLCLLRNPGSLASLRHLQLGSAGVQSLPPAILCHFHHLQLINLSSNLVRDLDDLGLPPIGPLCLPDLKTLDLSYNSIQSLGASKLGGLKRLAELRLEVNLIRQVDEEAFEGLGALKVLNLSSNLIPSLPQKVFQSLKALKTLDLRNNSLASLSPGLLAGLQHLVVLDLSRNGLTSQWATGDSFTGLVRLVILNLSLNQLSSLSPSVFNDLYSLQVLDLGSNGLTSVPPSTFSALNNLHSLNLARNRLSTLSARTLDGLYVLHKLSLDYNDLAELDKDSMANLSSLTDLGLAGNRLSRVPVALSALSRLKTLDLGDNGIRGLSKESFSGLGQLYGLRLVHNQIQSIPAGICEHVNQLRVFNAAQNRIRSVDSSAFVSCPDLRVLRLDANDLQALPPSLLHQLPSLLWLNVSVNGIRAVDLALLPPSLEWLDLSRNLLESLGGGGQGQASTRLRILEASHNRLTELDTNSIPASLDRLGLSHNQLTRIAAETFSRSSRLRRVELFSNQLSSLALASIRLPLYGPDVPPPEFLIGGNPFLCDCEMEWLSRVRSLSLSRHYPTLPDLGAVRCRLTYSRSRSDLPLGQMEGPDFLCPYTAHCFTTCQCCEFGACDCAMTCPPNCTCYHGDGWRTNVVDCSSGSLTSVPPSLPMDSTAVWLDGNRIPLLRSHSFLGRKNLVTLHLNSSGIQRISNKTFNSLLSLRTLHLDSNFLRRLHGYEFEGLSLLRELYLQNNELEVISNATFLPLKSLEVLRLDGNRLLLFPVWQLSLNPYLVEMWLGRNAWLCDCPFLSQLHAWLSSNAFKVADRAELACIWNRTLEPGSLLLDYNVTCAQPWALSQEPFDLGWTLPILLGSIFLMILVVAGMVFLCRGAISARAFGAQSEGSKGEESYDAYCLYSQTESDWAGRVLEEELERREGYRLLLHQRDILPGRGLRGRMLGGIQKSRSLVLLLTPSFLAGEWACGEVRSGVKAVIRRCTGPVILVLLHEIPEGAMKGDFKAALRRAARLTKLRWTEKGFWPKFREALPSPPPLYKPGPQIWPHHFLALQPPNGAGAVESLRRTQSRPAESPSNSERAGLTFDPKALPRRGTSESYVSAEGEHVYSTLDPPAQSANISLPNGYTYQSPPPKLPPMAAGARKPLKDPPNTGQTYLV